MQLRALFRLSRNLWWSWDPEATILWGEAAARLGISEEDAAGNPARLLARASPAALARLAEDPAFLRRLDGVAARFDQATAPAGRRNGLRLREAKGLPGPVAYFSMEFGVHESLPIYAGGLGILAGDHAKSASDLGLPLVGVGLFYHQGYFRQEMGARGSHLVSYPRARVDELPLEPVRAAGGRELRVKVDLPGRSVSLRVFRARVGRVPLLLLDAGLPENRPQDRAITDRLYIGDREMRIAQEVVCGIGGVRALRALGIRPAVWHLNEGHVAFLTLERIRELTASRRFTLDAAAEAVAADCVFTTHTPVPEGNEVFALDLARRYLAPACAEARIPVEEYLRLGLDHAPDGRPLLSMTVLALRLSRFRNGVSSLHGEVSRRMWRRLWPGTAVEKVPIGSITNGVHTPSWVAPEYDALYRRRLHPRWSEKLAEPAFWKRARDLPDGELWDVKRLLRERLIRHVRERVYRDQVRGGRSPAAAARAVEGLLDPEALTIGFARRFALYKRAGLIFKDLDRARRLFGDRRRPVQIIFAGKPHPEDPQGARLFEEVAAISRRREFAGRVALLPGYDIGLARRLVQGTDLWLNTPRRPLEASGTSGQKVAINCGLNLSVLDGWWSEGYAPGAGFAFGKPIEYADQALQDREDLESLYRVMEEEVLPLYFNRKREGGRGRDGVPRGWLAMVRASLELLVPRFSSHWMVSEYARQLYGPAAANGLRLRSGGPRAAQAVAHFRGRIERCWEMAHVLRAVRSDGGRRAEVDVFVAGLGPADLAAEVGVNGSRFAAAPPVQVQEGVVRFTFPLRGRAPARLRVWPRHSVLPHPRECGVSLEAEV